MTNFNFLLNNLSYFSSEDLVGRPMDSTCFRSAPVPPSFRLRLHPLRMVATLLLILCFGVGNVWGASYTLTFNTGSGDGSSKSTSTSASSLLSAGSSYVTGNLATASNVQAPGDYGVKLGVKSGAGDIKINLSTAGQVVPTKVSASAKLYNSGKTKTVQVCTNLGNNTATNATSSFADYEYSYSGSSALTYLEIKSSGYIWLQQIVVTYKAVVTFNANGGSCATSSLTQSTPTASITLPMPTRAGFTCTGWYTASSGGTKRGNAGATYTPSASETLYAQWESSAPACSNAVALSKGSATNGTVNTISSVSVATCSATASDRRVTITVTPDDCYDAPTNLTWTKTSGTVSASPQSGPTDNGDGTYSYVYQFAQNDNGAGTFGVTCTAKAAGKTVNFDAGPGSCLTSSLTETCDGSGVTLPAVTATGVCKGWTTFAGWATAAVSDSTTTSGVTLYAAGDNFVPASNGQTLYAVYSKNKGGGGASTSTLTNSSIVSSGNSSGYKTYCTSGCNKSPIDGWSGKFAVNYVSSGTHYSVQLGRATTSGASAYNTHLTSPTYASGATHISLTLSTSASQVTANGRKFYLMDTDELNYTAADQTSSYGVGTYDNSDDNYEVSFDVTGSPTQFHIYADGPAYIKTITVTYGGSTTYYCSDPNCCTQLASINGSVSWSNGQATLQWDKLSNVRASTPYEVSVEPSAGVSIGGIDLSGANATCSVTGLTAGTAYTFTINAYGDATHCDKDQEIASTAPQITVKSAPVALTGSDYAEGVSGGGTVKTFTVSGVGLTGALTFTAPTNFQVSTDNGSTWSTSGGSKTLAASGTLAETTIKARLVEGLSVGTYGGATTYITISGGGAAAVNSSVSITGTVSSACSVPTIGNPSLTNITGTTITVSCPTISGGTNCDVDEYGFIWKVGSAPTMASYDGKKKTGENNQSTAYNDGLSIDVANNTGTTYYIKAYAHNSEGNNVSSTALQVTPRSVTFNSNGGSAVATKYVDSGTKVTAPTAPTLTGYDFGEWQLNSSTFDFANTNVSENITLVATWTVHTHTLTWSWGGGSTSSTTYTLYPNLSGSVNYDATITKPADNTMSKTGYTFSSWSSSAATMPDNNLTITAQWTAKTTAITLNKNNNDASGSTAGTASWTYDQTTKNSITAATRTGYNVDGYYTAASDGTKILNADGSLAGDNITVSTTVYTNGGKWAYDGTELTLYAHWTLKTTTISFNQNGGTGGQSSTKTATYSQAMPTTITTPTKSGYTFTGYYESSGGTGTKYYNADGSSATNWDKENAAWTLYAGWEAKTDTYRTALHTGASGWTAYASGYTTNTSGAGYSIPAGAGNVAKGATASCEDTHYHFAGWVADDYKGSPDGHIITATGTTDATGTTYWAVWKKETAAGSTESDVLDGNNVDVSSTATNQWTNPDITGSTGAVYRIHTMGTNGSSEVIRWNANGYLVCTSAPTSGANLKSVTVVTTVNKNIGVYGSTTAYANNAAPSATSCTTLAATSSGATYNFTSDYGYIGLKGTESSTYINSITITYGVDPTYGDPKAVCEDCLATPSISDVSLTGSAFSTTSVPVQATGAAAGTNCSITEYGFYWGTSANPTGNKTASNNLSTGTFSAILTGPFETGTTYHYRAYATNEGDNTGYSSDATFTLHNVTFNMHDHGDAKAAQVVPEGGKVTNPGNPSAIGYTFDGWWANNTFSGSAWDFSTNTVGSGDLVLHAKWTEKPKYTITLNAGNGTISDANWTNTSGSTYTRRQANGDEEITLPTPSCGCAGWVFKGWSTTSKDNAASFTPDKADGASFTPASDVTYYAVYRQSTPSGTTYTKITESAALTTGDYLIVANNDGGSSYYAMGNSITSSHMTEQSSSNATSWSNPSATTVWTVIKLGDKVGFYNASAGDNAGKYLTIVDGAWVLADDGQLFTYSFNNTTKAWTFTSPSGKQMVYTNYFYTGDAQEDPIYLYKRGDAESGNYYTNPDCSDFSVTGVANPVAGGSVQLTAAAAKSGDKVWACYTADPEYDFTSWSISGTGVSPTSATTQFVAITVGTSDVTVTANFAAKVMYNVTWKANNVALTGDDLGSASVRVEDGHKVTTLPPTPSSCDDASTTFMGWVADGDVWSGKTDDVSDVTIYTKASDLPTVTGDVTYHAVWAKRNGSAAPATYAGTGVFTKITTMEELEVGAHYVLYGTKDDDASVKGAMNNTFTVEASGKNVFGASAVTISDNKITNPATTIVWKLGGTTDAYTLYSQNSSKYVEITARDTRGYTNPSSATTSFRITVSEGNFKIISNHNVGGGRMITIYSASVFRSYSSETEGYTLNLYKYGSNYTYDKYLVKCCEDPELAFDGEYNYQTLVRQDIHGAHGGNGSATAEQGKATLVLDYSTESDGTCTVEVKKLTGGDNRSTAAAGSSCANHTGIAINESTKKVTFDVWTYAGSYPTANGQGTYRIKITQDATSTYCAAETYYFVDVTLRDKFVDAVNGNATINVDGQSKTTSDYSKTPTEASLDGDKNDDCHSTTRRFLGWVREDNMDTWYVTGNSTRVSNLDDKKEDAAIVAPNADIITSGSTWYAVWGEEVTE